MLAKKRVLLLINLKFHETWIKIKIIKFYNVIKYCNINNTQTLFIDILKKFNKYSLYDCPIYINILMRFHV